jgi:hypothetical protein
LPAPDDHLRATGSDFCGGLAVNREMIFPAEPDVIDTGWMRNAGIEQGRRSVRFCQVGTHVLHPVPPDLPSL